METIAETKAPYVVPIHAYSTLDERIEEELSRFDLEKTSIPHIGIRYSFLPIVCVDWRILMDQSRVATLTITGHEPSYEYHFLNNGSSIARIRLDKDKEPVDTNFETWNQAIVDICKTIIERTDVLASQANHIAAQARNQAWRYETISS